MDGSEGRGRPARAPVRARGAFEGSAGLQLRGRGGDVPPPRGLHRQRMAGEGEQRGRAGLGALRSLRRRRGRGPRPPSRDARGRDDRTGRGGTQKLRGATIGEERERPRGTSPALLASENVRWANFYEKALFVK